MNSLEKLFTIEGILLDKNNDGNAEGLQGFIYIPKNPSCEIASLAIELAARIGYECVALDYPLIKIYDSEWLPDIAKGSIVLKNSNDFADEGLIYLSENGNHVCVSASSILTWQNIRRFLCGMFPSLTPNYTLVNFKQSLESEVNDEIQIVSIKVSTTLNEITKIKLITKSKSVAVCGIKLPHNVKEVVINNSRIPIDYFEDVDCDAINEQKEFLQTSRFNGDISNLFEQNHLLAYSNIAFPPNEKFTFKVDSQPAHAEVIALAHVAARFSLENIEYIWPLVIKTDEVNEDRVLFTIELDNSVRDKATLAWSDEDKQLLLKGNESGLNFFSQQFFINYPQVSDTHTLQDLSTWLTSLIEGKNPAGELLRVQHLTRNSNSENIKVFFNIGPLDEDLVKYQEILSKNKEMSVSSVREPRKAMQWEYSPVWEVNNVKDLLNDQLYPKLKKGDKVDVKVLVSEEKEIRDQLHDEIIANINDKGGEITRCHVYRAYKQGVCWLLEDVVPNLAKQRISSKIKAIRIGFRPFLPPHQTEWHDEAGATPILNSGRDDDPNKYFELPTRLLQELYPVDDLLALELPLKREDIEFYVLEKSEVDYRVECLDSSGAVLYSDTWNNTFSERAYIDTWSDIGKVHPNTGWVKVVVNDKLLINQRIKTDLENIWDYYQHHILPDVHEYIIANCNGELSEDMQPFFKELQLQITASEPDYQLPTRKDLLSTLDALHEDIYFIGLDYFRTMGLRSGGLKLGEPGLILPVIRKALGGSPKLKASLFAEQQEEAGVLLNNVYQRLSKINGLELSLNKLLYTTEGIEIEYNLTGDIKKIEPVLDTWLNIENNGLSILPINLVSNLSHIRINLVKDKLLAKQWNIPIKSEEKAANLMLAIHDVDISTHEVIGTEENERIITELSKVSELNVYEVATSYQGRKIHAIEVKPNFQADITSRTKLMNTRPTFLLNHRHHANEVSATNSAYTMLKDLLLKAEYQKYRQKLNIVIVPFENVDGAAIHYQLMQDNPEWKLHVARYNSVGKEIADDYFNEKSKYGECFALTRLYWRWLPDAFVDNHGVPSHEWDQQFAGYVSPWFKGFWLPRALFYGYFWYANEPKYAKHRQITEAVAKRVAQKINQNKEITAWNLDWQERFNKYAHQWLPKLFPAEYRDNLIYYWIPFKTDENARRFASRFPELTVLDWTTEVSDETAQGEYLELCSRALTISDFATMDVLANILVKYQDELTENGNYIFRSHKRMRPIMIE